MKVHNIQETQPIAPCQAARGGIEKSGWSHVLG